MPTVDEDLKRIDMKLPSSLIDRIEAEGKKDRRSSIRDEMIWLLEEALAAREKRR